MEIQELYNKLRIKREYGRGDVVTRLSFDEVDILLEGLRELGADTNAGDEHLMDFKETFKVVEKTSIKEKDIVQAYDGLRARANTGKYKNAVGFIHVVKFEKKPIKLIFPSGKEQIYNPNQIEIIEKDREKFDNRKQEIIVSIKGVK